MAHRFHQSGAQLPFEDLMAHLASRCYPAAIRVWLLPLTGSKLLVPLIGGAGGDLMLIVDVGCDRFPWLPSVDSSLIGEGVTKETPDEPGKRCRCQIY
ncbi:hypothetical protein ACLOJK_022134 [Asimina triloba]